MSGSASQNNPSAENNELVQSYDLSFQQALNSGNSIYEPMSCMTQAAHERRIALLDQLPIGDISDKTCVDYGVGSWGFACIYPRLQQCAYAIGIDISEAAVQESIKISASDQFPYGQNYRYFTSRGDQISLDSKSVDIFFAGESIEHVENTHAFLDEIHRILKPDGIFILTTPNADAYLFRVRDEHYAVGPEHVALMGYQELLSYLENRFEVMQAHGFNGSVHPIFDDLIKDFSFASSWASQFKDNPELGTGLVMMLRPNRGYLPQNYQQVFYHHSSKEINYQGKWKKMQLHKSMTGSMSGSAGDTITFSFTGDGIILNFWSHDWSGIAEIIVDGEIYERDLYSSYGGFHRIVIHNLFPGEHKITIKVSSRRNPRSSSHEIIFHQAITYKRT